jgi:hypothetical protein
VKRYAFESDRRVVSPGTVHSEGKERRYEHILLYRRMIWSSQTLLDGLESP